VSEDRQALDDFVLVDLGTRSLVEPIARDYRRFRVTMYDPRRMKVNHRPGLHRYLIARDVLEADLVLNVPKLKTHKKAGLTAALKNLVGINGNKDYLPHHRKGGAQPRRRQLRARHPAQAAGRGHPRPRQPPPALAPLLRARQPLRLPLPVLRPHPRPAHRHRGRLARQRHGLAHVPRPQQGPAVRRRAGAASTRTPQRAVLSLCDGLVAGEGDGPLRPDPRPFGGLLAAVNPAVLDWIAALVMGLDPARIPISARAFAPAPLPLATFPPAALQPRPQRPRRHAGRRWRPPSRRPSARPTAGAATATRPPAAP
jgi:hypothetical protein